MYSLDWAYAYGKPQATADFKLAPADFQVTEFFSAPFSGEGEHIVLQIEKKGLTTEEVVKSLSRLTHKSIKLISYAGLKDKHALTTQWLSIHAPGEVIDGVEQLEAPGWRVLAATRHNKKLKPSFLAGNHFVLTLRNVSNETELCARIVQVQRGGVPNYFGEQRFGRAGNNLLRAEELLVQGRKVKDKFLKGMYFSAARSWLYNLILSQRVASANWNMPLAGDVMQLSGSHSIFTADAGDSSLLQRIHDKDISPASPLPGKSKNMVQGEALELIQEVYSQWPLWLAGLNQFGLEEAWRANILYVADFSYSFSEGHAQLSFTLPPGAYATAVLRELVVY